MKKIAFIILASLSWTACKQTTGSETAASKNEKAISSVDSLNRAFDAAWNKKDSVAVISMLADDVILISGRKLMKGKNEVNKNFISTQMPVAGNLRIKKERVDASGDVGIEAGTWMLTITVPNKAPFETTGNYSFACKKDTEGKWKFSVLSMEDHDPETSK
jgi:ketosteroid isomerase-like protein